MSRRISQLRKLAEGRGTGELGNYKPWTYEDEVNSEGTCNSYPDPIHGRSVQLLSQGELRAYLKTRFDEQVWDIREQFPMLDVKRAYRLASLCDYLYPYENGERVILTTDMLIYRKDGSRIACSCKPNVEILTEKDKKRQWIEGMYWLEEGISWTLIETDKISKTLALNIWDAFEYYDEKDIHDKASIAKHLVATKKVTVNMETPINWVELAKELGL